MTTVPVVFVVDDDPSVRSSLKFLISSVSLQVESISPRFKSCWVRRPGLGALQEVEHAQISRLSGGPRVLFLPLRASGAIDKCIC